ncbi:hypothetical protein [Halobellus sp. GM3]|uniref:hypothetical protein n=1 Tax=Halobellus sp. GM3 TaxID=3458410 RepID=UPI00403DA725
MRTVIGQFRRKYLQIVSIFRVEMNRRLFLSQVGLLSLIGASGCVAPLLGYDVLLYNESDEAVNGTVEITDRNSGAEVFQEEFELPTDERTRYERIGNHQRTHEVFVETGGGLSDQDLWEPDGSNLHLTVRIGNDEIEISRLVG